MGHIFAQVDETLQLAKFASELETIKLLGVIMFLFMAVVVILSLLISRNVRSQDKQNETTVSGSFAIITKLVAAIDSLNNTIRELSVAQIRSTTLLDTIRRVQMERSAKMDMILSILLKPEQLQEIELGVNATPDYSDKDETP